MAGIIKAGTERTHSSKTSGVAFNFADMGSSYLTKVQAEANKIIEEARVEAAKIRKDSAEEGRRAAMQAVEATLRGKVEQQLTTIVPALKQAVQSVLDARQTWQRHWEQHALKLGDLLQPIRVVLTGSTVSEPVNELLAVTGRDESLGRLAGYLGDAAA